MDIWLPCFLQTNRNQQKQTEKVSERATTCDVWGSDNLEVVVTHCRSRLVSIRPSETNNLRKRKQERFLHILCLSRLLFWDWVNYIWVQVPKVGESKLDFCLSIGCRLRCCRPYVNIGSIHCSIEYADVSTMFLAWTASRCSGRFSMRRSMYLMDSKTTTARATQWAKKFWPHLLYQSHFHRESVDVCDRSQCRFSLTPNQENRQHQPSVAQLD